MIRVGLLMQVDPPCVDVADSVVELARTMDEHGLDLLPVCRDGSFLTMVSQADIVSRCVAAGLDPNHTPVAQLVDHDPVSVQVDTPAEEALLTILHTGRRCLAVLRGERLVGTVSQADLVEALPDETVSGIIAVVAGV